MVRQFLLWKTPLTRGEFRAVMQKDTWPGEWTEPEDDRFPANHVDFPTAATCCNALSVRDRLPEYYEVAGMDARARDLAAWRSPPRRCPVCGRPRRRSSDSSTASAASKGLTTPQLPPESEDPGVRRRTHQTARGSNTRA
ncbi:MAG: hypothetical protein IPK26_20225 [Planctomycetes bacterium]|nr:hypothetical protein [Planctomycetota bacterium]